MKRGTINSFVGAISLLVAGGAQAAKIVVNPDIFNVNQGATINATVGGTEFSVATSGGGFKLSYDDTVFDLVGTPTFAASLPVILGPSTINTGTSAGVGFIDVQFSVCSIGLPCTGVSGTFSILENVALKLDPAFIGTRPVDLALLTGASWRTTTFALLSPQPTPVGATVNVSAVPVPAAVWLFGSGVIGLVGVARRRKVQAV